MFQPNSRQGITFTVISCAFGLLAVLGGCGQGGPHPEDGIPLPSQNQLWPDGRDLTADRPGCDVLSEPAQSGGDFVVALTDSVIPSRAPVPHNSAERLVFAQLYETLVNVTCDGTIEPGLARLWACTEDSTAWVFTLRPDARLWDGTRITADLVKESWTVNQDCPRTRSVASPWSWFNARAKSISVLDAQRLAIHLPEPQADFPLLLAHPATAVALPRPGWTWPVGSGPCRLRATTPQPIPRLACRPNQHHPQPPGWDSLTFTVHPGADSRDLAARDIDLLIVRQQKELDYYRQAEGFSAHALPWDRLYLLMISPDQEASSALRWSQAAQRLDPPTDLTTISAISWPGIIYPAGGPLTCPQLAGPVALSGSAQRSWGLPDLRLDHNTLTFAQSDAGAREMAHRLGALAARPAWVVPLPDGADHFVLDWQMSGAQVLRLDLVFPTRCLQLATLLGKSAWIQSVWIERSGLDETRTTSLAALEKYVRPLALTRPWLVTQSALSGLSWSFDGTPNLSKLGRADKPATETIP